MRISLFFFSDPETPEKLCDGKLSSSSVPPFGDLSLTFALADLSGASFSGGVFKHQQCYCSLKNLFFCGTLVVTSGNGFAFTIVCHLHQMDAWGQP